MISIPPEKISLADALRAARETKALEIGKNVLGKTPEIFRQQFPAREGVIMSDDNTFKVAGKAVALAFANAGQKLREPFIFSDPKLYAEFKFVEQLQSSLGAHDAVPIAIGSGTINDLVKFSAHRLGRPYFCVGTAASMDGYTAFGASITFKGSKLNFDCPAPRAVLADIEIIRGAPSEMTASGYADLLAKITAGADWLLADALGVEPIDEQAWNIVQGGLRDALKDPRGANRGEENAITQLTEGLMMGGFAMQWAKSSRPAAGAEHQFSHLWDMEHHTHNGAAPSHGFKVGIGTLAVAALYEQLFELPLENLDADRYCEIFLRDDFEKTIRQLFREKDVADKAIEETRAKQISPDKLREQLGLLKKIWPELKPRLQKQLLPFVELKKMLAAAGAPSEPEQIGISRERLRRGFLQAYFIRRRFTILDLAKRAGVLDSCLDRIFGPGGVWTM